MRFQIEQPFPVGRSLVQVGQIKIPETFIAHLSEDEGGGPDVDFVFEVRSGSVECRAVHITATDDGHEVRVTGLAGIRVQDVLEETVKGLLYAEPKQPQEWPEEWAAAGIPAPSSEGNYIFPLTAWNGFQDPVKHVRTARAARKVKMTDELLREVAEVYRANVKHNPTEAVAEHFDREPRTARLYVKRARDKGFLGAAVKGKAGEQ